MRSILSLFSCFSAVYSLPSTGPQEAYPYGAKRYSPEPSCSSDCSKVKRSCCCNPCAANAQFWTKGDSFGQRVKAHLENSPDRTLRQPLVLFRYNRNGFIAKGFIAADLRSSVCTNRIHSAVVLLQFGALATPITIRVKC